MDITSQVAVTPQPLFAGVYPGIAAYGHSDDPYLTAVPRGFAAPLMAGLWPSSGKLAGSGLTTLASTTLTIPAGSHYFLTTPEGGVVHVYFPVAVTLAGVVASNYAYMYLSVGPDGTSYTVQLETATAVTAGALSIGFNTSGTWAETAGLEKIGLQSKIYFKAPSGVLTGTVPVMFYMPFAGKITKISFATAVAITSSNTVLTGKIGTTAITGGAITVLTAGSAVGVIQSVTPSGANTVAPGNYVQIIPDGAAGAGSGELTIEVTLS